MCRQNCCGCAPGSTFFSILDCVEDNDNGAFLVGTNSGENILFASLSGFDDCSVTGITDEFGTLVTIPLSGVNYISLDETDNEDAFNCYSRKFA
jgi:hypothetical protein